MVLSGSSVMMGCIGSMSKGKDYISLGHLYYFYFVCGGCFFCESDLMVIR